MYYDLAIAPSDSRSFGGGTQDNGTNVTTTGGVDDHFEILGGDGGWMAYHPSDPTHLFASFYNLNIRRHRNGAWADVSPPAPQAERASVWMVFIVMDPVDPSIVFTGSQRVWRSTDDGGTWQAVSGPLDGSTITAIEVAQADHRRVYVGTENGGVFRSTDGGATWSADISGATLPGFTITRLASSPADANVIVATVANFGHSHVFRSADGGLTWADIDRGRLPDVPHNSLVIPANQPQTLYVCSDA